MVRRCWTAGVVLAVFMVWLIGFPGCPPAPRGPIPAVPELPAPTMPDALSGQAWAPGEIIALVRESEVASMTLSMQQAGALEVGPNSAFSDWGDEVLLRIKVDPSRFDATLKALQSDPRVKYAEPNYLVQLYVEPSIGIDREPNDPLYKYQWHMRKINAVQAWRGSTGKGAVVAVIDTGVAFEDWDRFHKVEDFEYSQFVKGYNFIKDNEHAGDDHGHGTHVAGTVAQATHNGKGVVGVAYDARIMPLKVLSGSGSGTVADIADAIRFAADRGAHVINMSLGGPFPAKAMGDACTYAYKKGVIIVCAAGNSSSTNVGYPANYPECVAVSSVRDDDTLAWYSNRGKRIDLAAPGGDTRVDQNGDGYPDGVLQNTIKIQDPTQEGYLLFQGTSMASPHVAGAAALLVSLGVTKPDAILAILKKTARKEGLNLPEGYGAGIIDVDKAVHQEIVGNGTARLLLGVFVLGLAFWLSSGRNRAFMLLNPAVWFALVIGASGFFLAPYLGEAPYEGVLARPLPQWDMSLFGLKGHGNPIFYSAFFPSVVALAASSLGSNLLSLLLRGFSVGLSAGVAGCLVQAAAYGLDVHWVPGFLEGIWLVFNAAACLGLAIAIMSDPGRFTPKPPDEEPAD